MVASSPAREAAIQAVRGVTLTEEDAKIIMEYVSSAVHPSTEGSNIPMGIGEPQVAMKVGGYLTGSPKQVRYTRADMHEKAAASEQLSAQRNASAAAFLRNYPQFETFLELIKDGAITLY